MSQATNLKHAFDVILKKCYYSSIDTRLTFYGYEIIILGENVWDCITIKASIPLNDLQDIEPLVSWIEVPF